MAKLMQGLAVPFEAPTVIAEIGAGGHRKLYREVFDRKSIEKIPEKIPFVRAHQRHGPLGWARLDTREAGVVATLEPIDGSVAAADAVAEVAGG